MYHFDDNAIDAVGSWAFIVVYACYSFIDFMRSEVGFWLCGWRTSYCYSGSDMILFYAVQSGKVVWEEFVEEGCSRVLCI